MNREELEAKEQEKEQQKIENKRNASNNAQAIRMAASAGQYVPEGTVQGVSKAILKADQLTGGKSTELIGHAMNAQNKLQPFGKQRQQALNKLMESDAGQLAGKAATIAAASTAKSGSNAPSNTGNQTPPTTNTQTNQPQNIPQKQQNTNNQTKTSGGTPKTTSDSISSSVLSGDEKKSPNILVITLIISLLPLILLVIGIVFLAIIPVVVLESNPIYQMLNKFQTITITNTKLFDGEISFEDYIAGVVAADEKAITNEEYYKFIAIHTRTAFVTSVSSNTIDGNDERFKYVDVESNPNSESIKRAVEQTSGNVITKDDIIYMNKIDAKVTKEDDNYYYVEYGSSDNKNLSTMQISKDWEYISNYSEYLDNNKTNYDLIKIIAMYLITTQNYSYVEAINYIYGDVTIVNGNILNTSNTVNGFITPVQNFSCSNGYGCRYHPINKKYEIHSGVDLGAVSGEPVYAAKSGEIISVEKNVPGTSTSPSQSYGNYVTIKHEDGTQTRYAHLLYDSIPSKIYVGAKVNQGEKIGKVGTTGASTGPHLHYEVIIDGKNVNPYNYIDANAATNDPSQCNNNEKTPMSYCGY